MRFAILLKQQRESAGLTQLELARRSGLSAAAIRDLEQERSRRPRPASVRALTAALGLSPTEAEQFLKAAIATAQGPQATAAADPAQRRGPTRIAVLGPLTVLRGHDPVKLGTGRHRVLLLRLALTANSPVPRDELVELLWPGAAPTSAINLVQTYVSRLRRVLEPGLLTLAPNGYQLSVDEDRLDLLRFRQRVALAKARVGDEAASLLGEALELWRGDFDIAELRDDPLLTALTEEQIEAAIAHAALSPSESALPRLRRLARRHRWHEPLHARLIATLAATGRQAEALAVYAGIRHELAEELGIDPGPELARAHRGVLQQEFAQTVTVPREPVRAPAPFQAPAPPADFTGRKDDLHTIDQQLWRDPEAAARQATAICAISGVAGVGKTALALQAALRLRPCFPDGQLYIDLHGAGAQPVAPVQALARFLRALGVQGRALPTDEGECAALLRSELDRRRVLLVLDNARDSAQVRPLLPGAGGCAVIVTSRRRLTDLAGAVPVDLAALPPEDAVDLLASVAGRARVAADPAAARELAELCGLLPVALRVAGGRLANRPGWSLRTLMERLRDKRSSLGLTAGFQLSYQDLTPEVAHAFSLLSLIPGDGFPAEAEPAHERGAALRRLFDWWLSRVTAAIDVAYPATVRLPRELPAVETFAGRAEAMSWLDTELSGLAAAVEHAAAHGPRPRGEHDAAISAGRYGRPAGRDRTAPE